MIQVTSTDWFINQKAVPDKESVEYTDFWAFQEQLCKEGCNVQDVHIPGYLYWHLNFWKTDVDYLDAQGRPQQKYTNPILRDNEWLFFTNVERAEREQKGLAVGGSRRLGKSILTSSYIAHGATFDEHSQNIVAAATANDIKVTADKIDKGLINIPDYFRWQRIEDNWKSQVSLGVKTLDNRRMVFSTIYLRNLSGGNNQEALAGLKPRKLMIEEAGKSPFLKGLQAAIPGFTTPYGWTCSPIVIFTGGDMDNYADAQELFLSPEAYNFLEVPDEKQPSRMYGLFLGAKYRQETKREISLGEYLGKGKNHAARKIKIMVSDEEWAKTHTEQDLEKRKKSNDRFAYLKERMYFPFTVDDMFLNSTINIFNTEAILVQKQKLLRENVTGSYVELYHDGEEIRHKSSMKVPLTEFPVKAGTVKDCPIIMWEPPLKDAPFGLYIAAGDTYRQGQSKWSDSVGVIYIYKRMHSISSEKFQDMIVACYAARPEKKEDWDEQARLLIKYYNAKAMIENDELSFIEYMISKGDSMYLAETPMFLRDIIPNSSTLTRPYGLSRSSQAIRNWLITALKQYLEEIIHVEKDEEGRVVREVLGVTRIRHVWLLDQLLAYNEDDNFDAIVAASILFGYAAKLNPIIGQVGAEDDDRLKEFYGKSKMKTIFSGSKPLFSNNSHKLF